MDFAIGTVSARSRCCYSSHSLSPFAAETTVATITSHFVRHMSAFYIIYIIIMCIYSGKEGGGGGDNIFCQVERRRQRQQHLKRKCAQNAPVFVVIMLYASVRSSLILMQRQTHTHKPSMALAHYATAHYKKNCTYKLNILIWNST